MEILELAQFTAICHTNGCENKDIDIEITAPKKIHMLFADRAIHIFKMLNKKD